MYVYIHSYIYIYIIIYIYIYTAPVYLTELCVPVSIHQGRANHRSATHGYLSVAANKGTTYDRRNFAVSGPKTWKALLQSSQDGTI